mgnify:CR=1 FL=1
MHRMAVAGLRPCRAAPHEAALTEKKTEIGREFNADVAAATAEFESLITAARETAKKEAERIA